MTRVRMRTILVRAMEPYIQYAYYSVHEARDMMYAAKKVQNDLELRVVEYKPRKVK